MPMPTFFADFRLVAGATIARIRDAWLPRGLPRGLKSCLWYSRRSLNFPPAARAVARQLGGPRAAQSACAGPDTMYDPGKISIL